MCEYVEIDGMNLHSLRSSNTEILKEDAILRDVTLDEWVHDQFSLLFFENVKRLLALFFSTANLPLIFGLIQ